MTEIISLTITNLVTPKVGAKHELLFNKLASDDVKPMLNDLVHAVPWQCMLLSLCIL